MLRLEELRKRKGMSQDELAKAVGCTQAAISKFEIGESNPSLETLVKIASALDVSFDELIIREQSA